MTKFLALLTILASRLLAQTPLNYEIQRATGPIKIDGFMSEPAWAKVPPMALNEAESRTEAFLTYDSSNIYVAIRAYDPDPLKIRGKLLERDKAVDDDFVGVILGRGFEFRVNPHGVQMDLFQGDIGWDTIWESDGHIVRDGYVVEMAIPFTSLRLKGANDQRTWAIDLLRMRPRDPRDRIALAKIIGRF